MIKLGVNVDHVATVRQTRRTALPSPAKAARLAEEAGADGITAHLREDRRHIQDADIVEIKKSIEVPLNLEMAATDEMVLFAIYAKPTKVCLVPERRQELTTEGGLDVQRNFEQIRKAVEKLGKTGIEVSLFINPDPTQVQSARESGAPVIELHTGRYAESVGSEREKCLNELIRAAGEAHHLGLRVNAGHGLNYENTGAILCVPHLEELNIGHSIVAEAVLYGIIPAVRKMKEIIVQGAPVR